MWIRLLCEETSEEEVLVVVMVVVVVTATTIIHSSSPSSGEHACSMHAAQKRLDNTPVVHTIPPPSTQTTTTPTNEASHNTKMPNNTIHIHTHTHTHKNAQDKLHLDELSHDDDELCGGSQLFCLLPLSRTHTTTTAAPHSKRTKIDPVTPQSIPTNIRTLGKGPFGREKHHTPRKSQWVPSPLCPHALITV